jgi:hypothetical protein
VIPIFLVLLLGMLDFGFALYTNLTLEYASREGARVGAALAAGNSKVPCATVDDHVVAAVQRVLTSAGISVPMDNMGDPTKSGVNWIRIYKATNIADGSGYLGTFNEWKYAASGGPTVDGATLKFTGPGTPAPWDACLRKNGSAPDSLGVAINYTYAWQTSLAGAIRLVGAGASFGNLTFIDKTVMNLNPTNP